MSVEPLGSIMSAQAQGAVVQKPAVSVEKSEDVAVNPVQAVESIDRTTSVVENAQNKGQSGQEAASREQANNEQVRKAVEKLNKSMTQSEAIFGIHDGTNRVTIKIVDKKTKEVIKELPPEKTLDMIAKVWEMAGILVDEKR